MESPSPIDLYIRELLKRHYFTFRVVILEGAIVPNVFVECVPDFGTEPATYERDDEGVLVVRHRAASPHVSIEKSPGVVQI